ncbi:hypothetical protein HK102_011854 [Quaeritorhiza haematococci]|nr:hypothetical protein HK102_011854 [Quaeritorhiza haematococci]
MSTVFSPFEEHAFLTAIKDIPGALDEHAAAWRFLRHANDKDKLLLSKVEDEDEGQAEFIKKCFAAYWVVKWARSRSTNVKVSEDAKRERVPTVGPLFLPPNPTCNEASVDKDQGILKPFYVADVETYYGCGVGCPWYERDEGDARDEGGEVKVDCEREGHRVERDGFGDLR